jgi:hypothetical protein
MTGKLEKEAKNGFGFINWAASIGDVSTVTAIMIKTLFMEQQKKSDCSMNIV